MLYCLWFFCGLLGVCPLVSNPVSYFSSVVCLYLDVLIGGFWWGMTLGIGKAMLMRGGGGGWRGSCWHLVR